MNSLVFSFLSSLLLSIFAFYKKALTSFGLFTAFILSFIITYIGGITGFLILTLTFLLTIIADKVLYKKKKVLKKRINKSGKRDFIQVLANVGFGTLSLIIFYFTKKNIYFITYGAIMASSLADSMASEMGVLSKKEPIDICNFKPILKGISGGVTLLGTLLSLFGSFVIGLAFYFTTTYSIKVLVYITLVGFMGSIIDSILGSIIQVKYKCIKCNEITEKLEHCNNATIYFKGINFINNDIVNILNNLFVFILSIFIL